MPEVTDNLVESDTMALSRGEIAMSPIRFSPYIPPSDDDRVRFEKVPT